MTGPRVPPADRDDRAVDRGDRVVDQGDRAVDQGDRVVDQGDRAVDQGDRTVDQGDRAAHWGDRVILVSLGLLLTAAGVVALLVGAGLFGDGAADRAMLDPAARRFAAHHGWFWPVVAAGCGLVALLALGWLAHLFRVDRIRAFAVTEDALGEVRVPATALTDAVVDDLAEVAGVAGATAELRGRREPATLELAVTVERGTDVPAVLDAVCGPVLSRARGAVDRPDLRAQVRVGASGSIRRRAPVR
jgi:hypothetical protein